LRRVCAQLRAEGAEIGNVDVTVMAEAPRLAPHRNAMQQAIAAALGLPPRSVSIKATTTEGLGAVGAAAAIAAQALALVRFPA
jgi:2-C-methyl-D-erythritol 2,4-cyclodiphosphate synthase